MRNIIACFVVVAVLAAVTSTEASAWCGSESYSSYGDNSYNATSDNGGEDFRGGFERHDGFERRGSDRFEHRGFDHRTIGVSKVIRRQ